VRLTFRLWQMSQAIEGILSQSAFLRKESYHLSRLLRPFIWKMSLPTTNQQWTIEKGSGFDSLAFSSAATIPKLHEKEVLVKFHYASLSYRDLLIAQGMYPYPTRPSCVPGSDGAGEVVAVGPLVSLFKPGDKVITLFNQSHQASPVKASDFVTGLRGSLNGTFPSVWRF
jgi:hypothetical protein